MLSYRTSTSHGRYAVAAQDVTPGTVLLRDPAILLAIESNSISKYCARCSNALSGDPSSQIRCEHCQRLYYCSEKCRTEDATTHAQECLVLRRSGCRLNEDSDSLFLVRMFTLCLDGNALDAAIAEVEQRSGSNPVDVNGAYVPWVHPLARIFAMVDHEPEFGPSDLAISWARTLHVLTHFPALGRLSGSLPRIERLVRALRQSGICPSQPLVGLEGRGNIPSPFLFKAALDQELADLGDRGFSDYPEVEQAITGLLLPHLDTDTGLPLLTPAGASTPPAPPASTVGSQLTSEGGAGRAAVAEVEALTPPPPGQDAEEGDGPKDDGDGCEDSGAEEGREDSGDDDEEEEEEEEECEDDHHSSMMPPPPPPPSCRRDNRASEDGDGGGTSACSDRRAPVDHDRLQPLPLVTSSPRPAAICIASHRRHHLQRRHPPVIHTPTPPPRSHPAHRLPPPIPPPSRPDTICLAPAPPPAPTSSSDFARFPSLAVLEERLAALRTEGESRAGRADCRQRLGAVGVVMTPEEEAIEAPEELKYLLVLLCRSFGHPLVRLGIRCQCIADCNVHTILPMKIGFAMHYLGSEQKMRTLDCCDGLEAPSQPSVGTTDAVGDGFRLVLVCDGSAWFSYQYHGAEVMHDVRVWLLRAWRLARQLWCLSLDVQWQEGATREKKQ
ncbi:hypothetical protein PAPYR_10192 [Paratrimastix pyriformis]|uniref:MYND-type domain-containing protein n=1 Tax=Paratrimastix pyriformis TaxID=342808 RepID=A0ABQ8UAA6_9EUKA|nr:hypothetical protein PAPYR_10192 [Paratrimastix pyriformis]